MNIEESIYLYLTIHPAVMDLAGIRGYPMTIPQTAEMPCYAYQVISQTEIMDHDGLSKLFTTRVQFTCQAGSYGESKELARAIGSVLRGRKGVMGDLWVESGEVLNEFDGYGVVGGVYTTRVDVGLMYQTITNQPALGRRTIPNSIQFQTSCTVGDTFDPSITLRDGCPFTPDWDFGDGTTASGISVTKTTYTDAGPHTVTLIIPDIIHWLTGIDVRNDKITGDFLGSLAKCTSITSIRAEENLLLVSDLASVSNMTGLTSLIMGDRSGVYGSLASLTPLTQLTTLILSGTKVVSSIAPLASMTQMTYLDLHSNDGTGAYGDITGNLSDLTGLVNLTYLAIGQTRIAGNMVDIAAKTNLGALLAYNMIASPAHFGGSFADIPLLTKLAYIYLSGSQITGGTLASDPYAEYILVNNLGWSQATVDAFLASLYTNRALYTRTGYGATHTLRINGTNAAPSGAYQDDPTPSTGLEYVYKLANDPDAEGFIKWSITYTGGTAP